MEPNTTGENQEDSPFLPLATASQMSADNRMAHFWKWFQSRYPLGHPERFNAREQACKDFDAHEVKVKDFILAAEEQALADWLSDAENYRDEFLMPLRFRQSATGYCFVCFYRSEWEEFSPAEGGCYWMRRTPVACFPVSYFNGVGVYGHPNNADADQQTLERAKEYGRLELGLTFEGDWLEREGYDRRKVWGLRSSRPEADGEVMMECFPFQSATLTVPHYE